MKPLILSAALLAVISFTSCKNNTEKSSKHTTEVSEDLALTKISFGVRGNCGMCKSTIETAVKAVEGVSQANWNVDTKQIKISFDDTKTTNLALHNAIAAVGYDTEKASGNETAYNNLPDCCKYDHDMDISEK